MEYYYLAVSNVVLKSKYTAIRFIEDKSAEAVKIEEDLNLKETKITAPDLNALTCMDIKENVVLKMTTLWTERPEIEEGLYLLYRAIEINGFHIAVSDESIDVAINQYVVKNPPIVPSIRKEKDNILIKLNTEMSIEDYRDLLNDSGLVYVVAIEPDAYLSSIYGVILNRTNKTKLRSHNIIKLEEDHLLIEEADYITELINTLQQKYPYVQFYSTDSDVNDDKYSEFFKYKAQMADFTSDVVTTPMYEDPIYGHIITTTCQIDFEYHTADLVKFSRRRFDYQISRFLSDVTTCQLKFPNTDRTMSYTVHWDRATTAAGSDDLTVGTSMNESNKAHYRFSSNIKLVLTIYQVARSYPAIKRIILGIPIFVKNNEQERKLFLYDGTTPTFRPVTAV